MKTGRFTMFPGTRGGKRVQGVITRDAGTEFERARKALAWIYKEVTGRKAPSVSDANVIESLVRGKMGTRNYLEDRAQRQQEKENTR